ncbi:MAG: prepilin-type N-terminal cleavage/methylation domain-containing protein [candidate division Zixibacteria bacterium]|nr:prepilin-type N-terminal cleavage/methylation domain-containing protein [candidate division Zixibacteria bacterium]
MRLQSNQSGFTLVEVIMVIVILGILAAVAMKTLDSGLETSRVEETRRELDQLALAISGNPELFSNGFRTDFGYVGDVGSMPATLDALVQNPGYATWKGPYIKSDYSGFPDDYKRDAWGQMYVYSGSTTIKSVGGAPDTLTRILTSATSDLTANAVTALITDGAGNPPGDSASRVRVVLSYPNGAGGTNDSTLIPNSSGMVTFANCVPVGNRTIRAVYVATDDTVQTMVCVLPKSAVQSSLRFPGALWAASGGGGSPTNLQYVEGSAVVSGAGNADLEFAIENPTTGAKHITTVTLTYSKTAYYQIVKWGSLTVFDNSSPRAGSGETVAFSSGQTIGGYGQMITIQVTNFKSVPSGVGSDVDMSSTQITATFSDGSTITFTTP